MEIKVACASSLFKENRHDLKGIFTLFYNAVYAYCSLATMNMHNICDSEYGLAQLSDNRELVAGCILKTLETFQPDLEAAASRVSQFDREYKELKEMREGGRKLRKKQSLWKNCSMWLFTSLRK